MRRAGGGTDGGILLQVKEGFSKTLEETMPEHATLSLDDEWTKRMEVGKRELIFVSTAAGASPRSIGGKEEGGWMDESTEVRGGEVGVGDAAVLFVLCPRGGLNLTRATHAPPRCRHRTIRGGELELVSLGTRHDGKVEIE